MSNPATFTYSGPNPFDNQRNQHNQRQQSQQYQQVNLNLNTYQSQISTTPQQQTPSSQPSSSSLASQSHYLPSDLLSFSSSFLPTELQGGVSMVSSRRPSFAAEFSSRQRQGEANEEYDAFDLSVRLGATETVRGGVSSSPTTSLSPTISPGFQSDYQSGPFNQVQNYQYNAVAPMMLNSNGLSAGTESDVSAIYTVGSQMYESSTQQRRNSVNTEQRSSSFSHTGLGETQDIWSTKFPSFVSPKYSMGNHQEQQFQGPPDGFYDPETSGIFDQNSLQSRRHSIATDNLVYQQPFGVSGDALPGQQVINLDDGLIVQNNRILSGPRLQTLYTQVDSYFHSFRGDQELASFNQGVAQLREGSLPTLSTIQLSIPPQQLYLLAFKAGRLDVFFLPSTSNLSIRPKDVVIVDADRGQDIGKVVRTLTLDEARVLRLKQHQDQQIALSKATHTGGSSSASSNGTKDVSGNSNEMNLSPLPSVLVPKQILRFAQPNELNSFSSKASDEAHSVGIANLKIRELGLTCMRVVDAEYQFDRRKLTFFYVNYGKGRVDFRGLVKELFRVYKTRIWMCAVRADFVEEDAQENAAFS